MLGLVIAFAIEALFAFAYGAKECGGLDWGIYFMLLVPGILMAAALTSTPPQIRILAAWMVLPLAMGFLIGGLVYGFERNRRGVFIAVGVLAVAALVVGALVAPHASVPCEPL